MFNVLELVDRLLCNTSVRQSDAFWACRSAFLLFGPLVPHAFELVDRLFAIAVFVRHALLKVYNCGRMPPDTHTHTHTHTHTKTRSDIAREAQHTHTHIDEGSFGYDIMCQSHSSPSSRGNRTVFWLIEMSEFNMRLLDRTNHGDDKELAGFQEPIAWKNDWPASANRKAKMSERIVPVTSVSVQETL